jgi:hypothetical protein
LRRRSRELAREIAKEASRIASFESYACFTSVDPVKNRYRCALHHQALDSSLRKEGLGRIRPLGQRLT